MALLCVLCSQTECTTFNPRWLWLFLVSYRYQGLIFLLGAYTVFSITVIEMLSFFIHVYYGPSFQIYNNLEHLFYTHHHVSFNTLHILKYFATLIMMFVMLEVQGKRPFLLDLVLASNLCFLVKGFPFWTLFIWASSILLVAIIAWS